METSVNTIVSKPLRVTPLVKGQTAEFRLCIAGVVSAATDAPAVPQGYIRVGRCLILDPHDDKDPEKLIYNVTGTKSYSERGKTYTEPVIGPVRFGQAPIILDHTKNNQYMFMKLDDKNRDNPNRRPTADMVYYEFNEEKEAFKETHRFEYKTMAANLLLSIETGDVYRISAAINNDKKFSYKIDLNKKLEEVRRSMIGFVETQPQAFIIFHGSPSGLARISVDRLVDDRKILFDEGKSQWFWRDDKKAICKVVKGNHAQKALIDFLLSEAGSENMAEVKSLHSDIYSALAE